MKPISFAVTVYNRTNLLLESFAQIYSDPRIEEIVIVDDCSDVDKFIWLRDAVKDMPKVKLFQNEWNLGMSRNKREAVEKCSCEWVWIFDSDNVALPSALDAMEEYVLIPLPNVAFQPSALPHFDYSIYAGRTFSANNAKFFLDEKDFRVALNSHNFIVNREFYLDSWVYDPEIKGSDSIWYMYNHFKNGGKLQFVRGMNYIHRIPSDGTYPEGDGSGWMKNHAINTEHAHRITELIRQL